MLTYFALAALANALTSAFLGVTVWAKNRQSEINRTYAAYCLTVTWWSASYFIWQVSTTSEQALLWSRLLMAGAIMIPIIQTRFIRRILGLPKPAFQMFLLYLYVFLFESLNWTDLFIKGVANRGGFDFWPVAGPLFSYFLIIWVGIIIYNFVLLLYGYLRADLRLRSLLLYITVATAVSYIGGATNYPLWYDINIKPWGNIAVSLYVVIVAYAIMRHRILNVKLLQTEALVISVGLLLSIDLVSARDWLELGMRFVTLLIFLLIGSRFIRATRAIEVANRQLRRDKHRLVELDRLKDEFLKTVTHELNTPLTVIRGKLDMALSEDAVALSDKQKDWLGPVKNEADRLAKQINDITTTTLLSQNQLALNLAVTPLQPIIGEVIERWRPLARSRRDHLVWLPPRRALPAVELDRAKFSEVLSNIVSNALMFTEQGSVTVTVGVSGQRIMIMIKDTGVGIKEEDQKRLFDRFAQANRFDGQKPQEQSGVGLSLYLAREILRLHGGDVKLRSRSGHGTTVTIELPVAGHRG